MDIFRHQNPPNLSVSTIYAPPLSSRLFLSRELHVLQANPFSAPAPHCPSPCTYDTVYVEMWEFEILSPAEEYRFCEIGHLLHSQMKWFPSSKGFEIVTEDGVTGGHSVEGETSLGLKPDLCGKQHTSDHVHLRRHWGQRLTEVSQWCSTTTHQKLWSIAYVSWKCSLLSWVQLGSKDLSYSEDTATQRVVLLGPHSAGTFGIYIQAVESTDETPLIPYASQWLWIPNLW